MSNYTPTTEEVRIAWTHGFHGSNIPDADFNDDEFYRWLAARDAEGLAAAGVAPQPEYEYATGAERSDIPGEFWVEEKARNREQAEGWMDEYAHHGSFANALLLRRVKAGAWEPVPNQEGEQS